MTAPTRREALARDGSMDVVAFVGICLGLAYFSTMGWPDRAASGENDG